MNPRAVSVEYKQDYHLILTFSNNEVKEFDLTPYLTYPIYEQLKDKSFCKTAKVDQGVVVWDDEIDFDPDTIYIESKPLVLETR